MRHVSCGAGEVCRGVTDEERKTVYIHMTHIGVFKRYTGGSEILCAPDDYSTKKPRKNILNSSSHLP
jgi:hypothetical protein